MRIVAADRLGAVVDGGAVVVVAALADECWMESEYVDLLPVVDTILEVRLVYMGYLCLGAV